MILKIFRGLFVVGLTFYYSAFNSFAQLPTPEKVGSWTNITGFAINNTEDYLVVSIMVIGKEKLYESYLKNGVWDELKSIEPINTHLQGSVASICNPFLSFDGKKLFYQADFSDSKGGFDIYYSVKTTDGWSKPINMGEPINTQANECYPSITPGEESLFFSISQPTLEFRKPKESGVCQKIYQSIKSPKGMWNTPVPVHDAINKGCECGPVISNDGKTLYFSSINPETYRDGFDIYHTQMIFTDSWKIPEVIADAKTKLNDINPRFVNGKLYFLNQWAEKNVQTGTIYRVALGESFQPLKTIESVGKVVVLKDKSPVEATLTVFDPTTLKVLGNFVSDKNTGEYKLHLLDKANYIVDVRKHGYSFASFMVDYRGENKISNPELIEVFDSIQLDLTVYDKDIFKPLEANVIAENVDNPGKSFKARMVQPGLYRFSIPLGSNYNIKTNAPWFNDSTFLFKLEGDIVFSKFVRELPLTPKKKPVDIKIFDSENNQALTGEILITNLNRDETITFTAEDIKNGKVTAMLREGDSYEFTVRGAQGYSFFNQVVDLAKEEPKAIEAELVALKSKTSIRLNNINFGSNSADLSSESFPELNRVVTLILDNPNIKIEIAAHTDNVGNAGYNLKLSEKRAQAVVSYLLDNNVPADRIVAKGYGLTKPMVPNTSDENKAKNRRVEFNILEVIEGGNK